MCELEQIDIKADSSSSSDSSTSGSDLSDFERALEGGVDAEERNKLAFVRQSSWSLLF